MRLYWPKNFERFAWLIFLLSLGLLALIPKPNIISFACSISAGFLLISSLWQKNRKHLAPPNAAIIIYQLILTISLCIGLLLRNPPVAALKIYASLSTLFFFVYLLERMRLPQRTFWDYFLFAILFWTIKILYEGIAEFFSGASIKWMRLTLVTVDAAIPFALFIFAVSLFSKKYTLGVRILIAFISLFIIVWSGYRSQQLLCAFMIIIKCFASRRNLLIGLLGTLALALVIEAFPSDNDFLTAQLSRYYDLSEERAQSGRALERSYALDNFLESPGIGKGLGYQIPSNVTFETTETDENYNVPESVSYLHNSLAFMAMSGGISLAAVYALVWLSVFFRGMEPWRISAAFALFAFSLVEATFLLIHFNFLLAMLLTLPNQNSPNFR